jgi:hypothetical protein
MELPVPVLELFDCSSFELGAHLPPPESDAWEIGTRERRFEVHRDTRSILFTWLPNDWVPGSAPQMTIHDYAPPDVTRAARACGAAIARHFGGQIVKLMLAELRPGGVIRPHRDTAEALRLSHRCHVPVVTNPLVEFRVDDQPLALREGVAYEIDNTRPHEVANRGATPRVHLICDVMPWAKRHARP